MPTLEQADWFLRTGSVYGLGFVAIAVILALIFYGAFFGIRACLNLIDDVRKIWLPQLVGGHLTFLEHTKVSNAATAQAVTKLTESYEASSGNHSKTHRALECLIKATQSGEICNEAREYLDEAIRELK
jgi:hypothetical protein